MATQSTFRYTSQNFDKLVMNGRAGFPKEAAEKNKRVLVTIDRVSDRMIVTDKAGDPVQSIQEPGTPLEKRIINVRANSGIAKSNPDNIKLFKDARAAEKAGDTEKAHNLFQTLANKLQITFNLLLPSSIESKLTKNTEISANLQLITTDNGSLMSLDAKTIAVMEPEVFGSFTSFEVDDDDTDAAPVVEAAAALTEA